MEFLLEIKIYAAILLVVRVASMVFMGFVLKRQLELFKLPIDKRIKHFREVLFILALGVFLGNLIPAGIDILTIIGNVERSARYVNMVSLLYTLSASFTSLISSYLIWKLYRLAHDADKITDFTEQVLINEETNERE